MVGTLIPLAPTTAGGVVTGGRFLGMPCIVNDIATGKPTPGNILPSNEVTADGQAVLNTTYILPNLFMTRLGIRTTFRIPYTPRTESKTRHASTTT